MKRVRPAGLADIDTIMKIEELWPEDQRASREKMLARLAKFPAGFWVFIREDEVIGTLNCCLIRYDRSTLGNLKDWNEATNYGYFPDISLEEANALFFVNGIFKKEVQSKEMFSLLLETPVKIADSLGLAYVVGGATLPGYDFYCRKHGEVAAADYAFMTERDSLVDLDLEDLRKAGYVVPDRSHVLKDFHPDLPSRNYGAIVVRTVPR